MLFFIFVILFQYRAKGGRGGVCRALRASKPCGIEGVSPKNQPNLTQPNRNEMWGAFDLSGG